MENKETGNFKLREKLESERNKNMKMRINSMSIPSYNNLCRWCYDYLRIKAIKEKPKNEIEQVRQSDERN